VPRQSKVPTPAPPGYVWAKEASLRTGLSVKTLYNYRHLGLGPAAVPIGRKLAYSIAAIDAYMRGLQDPEPSTERAAENRPPEPCSVRRRMPQKVPA
jgi:predicted DNA-binding transcriptional regulator AlpA